MCVHCLVFITFKWLSSSSQFVFPYQIMESTSLKRSLFYAWLKDEELYFHDEFLTQVDINEYRVDTWYI